MGQKPWYPRVALQGAALPVVPRKGIQPDNGPGQSRLIEKTNLQVGRFVCLLKCSSTRGTELGPLMESDDTGRNILDWPAFNPSKNKISITSGLNGDRKDGHQQNKICPGLLILNIKGLSGKLCGGRE